jgi:hypothetical protein
MKITQDTEKFLPEPTIKILEKEIEKGTINQKRDWDKIYKYLNHSSRSDLLNTAYLSGNALNSIINRRKYYDEESVWASFRRGGYGPVLTRLAISSIEMNVKREEVRDLMRHYEEKGVIPPEQALEKVVERAWFIAGENEKGIAASSGNEMFKENKISVDYYPLLIEGGLNLTQFETKKLEKLIGNNKIDGKKYPNNKNNNENKNNKNRNNKHRNNIKTTIFIDKNGKIFCQIKINKFKIKTKLKLPGKEISYLRYLIDSHFIPLNANLVNNDGQIRIQINIDI